jgi:hypothetical protein
MHLAKSSAPSLLPSVPLCIQTEATRNLMAMGKCKTHANINAINPAHAHPVTLVNQSTISSSSCSSSLPKQSRQLTSPSSPLSTQHPLQTFLVSQHVA